GSGRGATKPRVAIDAAGGAVAVWRRFDGTSWRVQAAVRAPGGAFAAPVTLSAAGQDADDPQVDVNPAGEAMVVWQRFNGSSTVVQAALRPAGRPAFSAGVTISAAGQNAQVPQVAIDAAGGAAAVWR